MNTFARHCKYVSFLDFEYLNKDSEAHMTSKKVISFENVAIMGLVLCDFMKVAGAM